MAQGGKPKNRTCETCGKSLPKYDFQKDSKVCIDCVWSIECGIKCTECGVVFRPSEFGIAAAGNYRKATCRTCCTEGRRAIKISEAAEIKRSIKDNLCSCGSESVGKIRGEYLCYVCMNPASQLTRGDDLEILLNGTSLSGSALAEISEENDYSRHEHDRSTMGDSLGKIITKNLGRINKKGFANA